MGLFANIGYFAPIGGFRSRQGFAAGAFIVAKNFCSSPTSDKLQTHAKCQGAGPGVAGKNRTTSGEFGFHLYSQETQL
jgi:hypothetical protein